MSDSPKKLCILPWVHTQIGIDGSIMTCCEVPYHAKMTCKNDESLTSAWNNENYREIRKTFLRDEAPSQCDMCFKKESLGHESDRMKANDWYKEFFHHIEQTQEDGSLPIEALKSIDLRLSNICNYKCRTCDPSASSALAKDWVFLTKEKVETPLIKAFAQPGDFLEYLGDLSNQFEKIFFVGGEPFLMAEQFQLIKKLNNSDRSKSLKLYYNTNLSVQKYGRTDIVELLKGFKEIIFNISIDATHERGAYIREGFSWETFKRNFWHFSKGLTNLNINLNITVSNINGFYLPEIIETCVEEFNVPRSNFILNPVLGPKHYTLWNLPADLKEKTLKKLEAYRHGVEDEMLKYRLLGIINFIKEQEVEKEIKAFKQITKRLDQIKGVSFQELFPELASLLD